MEIKTNSNLMQQVEFDRSILATIDNGERSATRPKTGPDGDGGTFYLQITRTQRLGGEERPARGSLWRRGEMLARYEAWSAVMFVTSDLSSQSGNLATQHHHRVSSTSIVSVQRKLLLLSKSV